MLSLPCVGNIVDMEQHNVEYSTLCAKTFLNLWRNWALSFGSIILLIAISLIVPRQFMPLIALGEAYLLNLLVQIDVSSPNYGCVLCVRVVLKTLFWTAVAMFIFNLFASPMVMGEYLADKGYPPQMPLLASLFVFPIAAVNSLTSLSKGNKSAFCRKCRLRYGTYEEEGVMSQMFRRESRYQLIIIAVISIVMTVVDWIYFMYRFSNVNLNSADKFFFVYVSIAIYVVSLFLMGLRNYQTLLVLRTDSIDGGAVEGIAKVVRFTLLSGDYILLKPNADSLLDVPYIIQLTKSELENVNDVERLADSLGLPNGFKLKYLFRTHGFRAGAGVVQYAIVFDADFNEHYPEFEDGEWCTLDTVDRYSVAGRLSPQLSHELHRIHTIAMAWKTYDLKGNRLYPIKNYRPTFRLRDLPNWSVDYDDLRWLSIAENNEDSHFFVIRKYWHKLFGIFNRR
jgi:hypothetical protein